jgi:hypothetical protein
MEIAGTSNHAPRNLFRSGVFRGSDTEEKAPDLPGIISIISYELLTMSERGYISNKPDAQGIH